MASSICKWVHCLLEVYVLCCRVHNYANELAVHCAVGNKDKGRRAEGTDCTNSGHMPTKNENFQNANNY